MSISILFTHICSYLVCFVFLSALVDFLTTPMSLPHNPKFASVLLAVQPQNDWEGPAELEVTDDMKGEQECLPQTSLAQDPSSTDSHMTNFSKYCATSLKRSNRRY